MALNKDAPKTRMVQLLDLRHIMGGGADKSGKLTRNEGFNDEGTLEHCYFASPFDAPSVLRFFRRLSVQKPGKKATVVDDLGVTMEYACLDVGIVLYVKHDRMRNKDGTGAKLTVIIEDADGREVVASYER